MKITTKQFDEFKKCFLKYYEKFGLQEYRILFQHKQLSSSVAEIVVYEAGKVATVYLTVELPEETSYYFISPEIHAKHEAIHLLIMKLSYLAECRYVQPEEVDTESEALVRRLEKLIP